MANTLDELKQFIADKKQGINKTVKGAVATALTLGVLGTATACGNTPVSTTPSTPAETVATVATTDTTATTPVETTATTAEETTATTATTAEETTATTATTPVETTGTTIKEPIKVSPRGTFDFEDIETFDDIPEISPEIKSIMIDYMEGLHPGLCLVEDNIIYKKFDITKRTLNLGGKDYEVASFNFLYNYDPLKTTCTDRYGYLQSLTTQEFDHIFNVLREHFGENLVLNSDNVTYSIYIDNCTEEDIARLYSFIHNASYAHNGKYEKIVDDKVENLALEK